MAAIPESAKLFMSGLIDRARKLKKTIAFPEGTDARVLEAAARLAREGVVKPVLIGLKPANAPEGVTFVDPANSPQAALHCVGLHPRARLVSSVFIMALRDLAQGHNGLMAFADCAVVVTPNAMQMADI